MSMKPIRCSMMTATAAFALLLSIQTDSALARERPGAAARGGAAAGALQRRQPPQNRTLTRTSETRRIDNGYVRNSTITNGQGQTATQERTVINDREAGTRSVDVTRTGFDGKTRSMSLDMQRTEDGHTTSRTLTNAEGETATRNTSVSNDREAGVRTRESGFTTFDGRSGSSSTTTTRTDTGFARETSATLPNGQTIERSVTKDCDRDAGKCTTTVVHDRN
jgi:hypothetical protein